MATTRIKDLSKTATTVNSDANLVLDGNTGGTQKITRDNFRQDTADAFVAAPGTYNLAPINSGTGKIDATYLPTSSDTPKGAWNASTNTPTLADGSGTAGDYYDVTVAGSSDLGSGSITFTVGDVVKYDGTTWFKIDSVTNILDGVSTIDGAKAAIEIPTVGSSANEVSLNGQLGTMAFQDASGVSVANLEITDKIDLSGAPTQQLEVYGDAPTVRVTDTSDGVGDGDSIGKLEFYGSDGSSGGVGVRAKIDTVSETAAGNQYGVAISTSTANSAPVERVRVDGAGRVGIGGSPSELLHLTNATAGAGVDANIRFSPTTSTTRYAEIQAVNSDGNNNIDLRFFTAPAGTPVERLRIDSQGRVGVAGAPGSYAYSGADDLVVGDATGSRGITISSGSSDTGALYFGDAATTGLNSYRGMVRYSHSSDSLELGSLSQVRWTINSTGNLVAGANLGIDFGQATTSAGQGTGTTGTVSNQVLSDYEFGSWVPTFATGGTNFTTMTMDVLSAQYVKIGRFVHCQAYIRTDDVDATGATGGVVITGLPFVADTSSGNYGQLSVAYSYAWVNAPDTGYVGTNSATAYLFRSTTTGTATIVPSDLTSGTTADQNIFIFSLAYVSKT